MKKNYVIGLDYGTLSGRAILLDLTSGEEAAESVFDYPHGVMDESLPTGEALGANFALQHPEDYLDVLRVTIPDVLQKAGVSPDEIAGVGIDFTACTVLPIDREGTPLCMKAEFAHEKHAYVKLWKHHAAQAQADRITALAEARGEEWLSRYGGKISSEWALPKILETLENAPKVYESTYRFLEAADWLSLVLTGEETHSAPFAGYKWLWSAESGYPSNDFMKALSPSLDGIVGKKIGSSVSPIGGRAGVLCERGASLTTLPVGTPLALPMIDAHAAMPALNITGDGDLMLILGTSACHILNSREGKCVEGICGYVKDGVIPSLYTYEAGQAAVGDVFDWFVHNGVPAAYEKEAEERGVTIHALLREKASAPAVGESGLVALDWLNGNRSILVDSSLKGMVFGLTLQTKPEEIYRAFIEATAFGLKIILDQYEKSGIAINSICAAGGIAQKDALMMQIYADVLGREIRIAGTKQAGALGSAIYASAAAGAYSSIPAAAQALARPDLCSYRPIEENVRAYRKLFEKYKLLHDLFGREYKEKLLG